MSTSGPSQTSGSYLRQVLRPFVRWALRRGLRLPDIQESLRKSFVEVAAEEIRRLHQKPSVSRIAVATGMNRRDVQRAESGERFRDITMSLPTRVLALWRSHPEYTERHGKPRVLSFGTPDSEFFSLVQLISQDVHPASVLFELERVGAVVRGSRGVQLANDGYASSDPEQGVRMLSQDLEQLLFSVDENIFSDREHKNLHVRTVATSMSMADAPAIQDWLLREGGAFHRKVRDFLAGFTHPQKSKGGKPIDGQLVVTSFGRLSKKDQLDDE